MYLGEEEEKARKIAAICRSVGGSSAGKGEIVFELAEAGEKKERRKGRVVLGKR